MNEELISIYQRELKILENAGFESHDFDGPLLMNCWEEDYLNSKYKMLFLGRESNGWFGKLNFDIYDCIKRYKDFELCNEGDYTTFWQYIYETKNILMPKTVGQKNFLWSNVSKFSNPDGTAIDFEDFKTFCDNFNVLQSEIEIAKPDVIIFFSGNSWDEKIQYQINDKISFERVSDNIPANELSRLVSDAFPYHTYRLAHPRTLQFQKKWNYMELIIENIRLKPIERWHL